MGLFRILLAYLMRNEQLINKLADSKPIRRSAQLVAYLLIRARTGALPSKRLQNVRNSLKEKLQEIKDEIKKNSPK